MTSEEAVKFAKNVDFCAGCWHSAYGIKENDDVCESCEHGHFLELVIEALEVRIPKPYHDGYNRAWGVKKKVKACPVCDYFIDEVHFIDADGKKSPHIAYCGHCGQAIDYDTKEGK